LRNFTTKSPSPGIWKALLLLIALTAAARIGYFFYQRRVAEESASAKVEDARRNAEEAVQGVLQRQDVPAPSLNRGFPCVSASVSGHEAIPQIGECTFAADLAQGVDRFEADLRLGRFLLRQTDLSLKDSPGVRLTRSYNSRDYLHPNRVHAFGRNANHPYDIALVGTRYPYTYQLLVFEDGDFLSFDRVSDGTGFADAIFQHTETPTRFYKAVTSWNGNGWTTRLADGSRIVFPEAYQATNMAQGAPTEMVDSAGNKLELIRDASRNLVEIRARNGPPMKFTYDEQSRIVRAEAGADGSAKYAYNAYGMLTDVVLSSGRERHYSYDGDLMTSVKDEAGAVLVQNVYSGEFLVAQKFSGGQKFSYEYSPGANRTYAESALVTGPDGSRVRVELGSSVPQQIKNPRP